MHFARMRGIAERHMPASAEKDRDYRRRNERQGYIGAAAGEGLGRDAEADREGGCAEVARAATRVRVRWVRGVRTEQNQGYLAP